ncbi:SOS response-associated peptidase family protein [Vibrio fluvialis]|nr:SOS response-associated peptidase family protein [Vibrio fluvialis]ELG2041955.1 SOS response-associated peptidase family protein [Vibrio fluvialis]MBY8173489.1 SOS response-associated peptidase [Vibrio fluvialis]
MCGRLNVIDDPLCRIVCERLGIKFSTNSNKDIWPSETVSTVIFEAELLKQLDLQWGIKPDWSKRLIINAQSETAHVKPTFKHAFDTARVIVPLSGWYEWSELNGKKEKFLFSRYDDKPLYMAGLAFKDSNQLVTLTTKPTQQCAAYHNRMPLIIDETDLEPWLMGTLDIINYVPPEQVQYQIHPEH